VLGSGMLSVRMTLCEAHTFVSTRPHIWIACENTPQNAVLSGETAHLQVRATNVQYIYCVCMAILYICPNVQR